MFAILHPQTYIMSKTQKHILAIYVRVSTSDQAIEGLSVDNQIYRGKLQAKKLGIEFRQYVDAGLSGELPIEKRPKLREMFSDIEAGIITTVYVLNQSRLDRGDLLQFLTIIAFFKKHKTVLYFDTEHKPYDDINTELSMNIIAAVNHNHNQQLSVSIKSNLEKRILDGKAPAGRLQAYGYDKDPKGYLIIHEEEAKAIKIMFDLANTANSVVTIAKYLNKLGYKTKVDKDWTGRYVYNTLTKSMYKGVMLHGNNGKKKGVYSRKEYPCPAIIDAVLYDNVQEQLKSRNTFKDTNNTEFFLLKGLLYCRVCGKGYYVHKPRTGKKALNTYQCKSGIASASCGNKGLYVTGLDKIITDNTLNLVGIIEEAFSDNDLAIRTKHMVRQAEIAKGRLEEYKTEKQRLVNSIVKGWIKEDDTDIAAQMEAYNIGIKTATNHYNECQKELGIVNHKEEILELCRQGVNSFKKMKDQKEKVDFLRSVINKVEIQYDSEEKAFDININFKLNQLEKYLIIKKVNFKTPLIRNESINNPTILSEKITLEYLINIDEETSKVIVTQPTITFDDYMVKHTPKKLVEPTKKRR